MNYLKGVTSVKDHGKHFEVVHEKQGTFKVAKHGLDKRTTAAIQAMCSGGMVKGYADGGKVAPDPHDASTPQPTAGSAPMDSIPTPASADDLIAPRVVNPSYGFMDGSSVTAAPGSELTDSHQELTSDMRTALPPPDGTKPSDTEPLPPPQQLPPVATSGQPPVAAVKAPELPAPTKVLADYDKQAAALRQGADIGAAEEQEKKEAYDKFTKQEEVRNTTFEQTMKARSAQNNQLFQDVASFKVTPNQAWGNMSSAQKASSLIGMVLGGIGAALTHTGENQAVTAVNRIIDQDIDAQKTELGKKENQLQENLRQTGDLRQAEMLTRAQRLAAFQGQIAGLSAKYAGAKGQANAQYLAAELGKQRDMLQYQFATQRAQLAAGQTQQQQYQAAVNRLMAGVGTPSDEAIVGDKFQERIVDTPSGRAIAHSPDSAKAYREEAATYGSARDSVRELLDKAKQLQHGTLDQKTRGEVEARVKMLQLELPAAIAGIKRLNENEYNAAVDVAPNPTELRVLNGQTIGKLNALGAMLDNRMRVTENTHLIRPRKDAIAVRKDLVR